MGIVYARVVARLSCVKSFQQLNGVLAMKSMMKVFAIVLGIGLSGSVYAECPDELPLAVLLDCIVVEGAGDDFDTETALQEESLNLLLAYSELVLCFSFVILLERSFCIEVITRTFYDNAVKQDC